MSNAAISGLFTGGAYALIGVSIALMFRTTGVLSFAQAAFAAVGAYVYVDLAGQPGEAGWPRPLAAIVAVSVTVVYGVVVERIAIRPVRHAPAAARVIATLGVLTLTTGLLLWRYGFEPLTARLLLPDRTVQIGGVGVAYQQVAVLIVAALGAGALGIFLYRTRFGTAVRAEADDLEAARLCGIAPPAVARFSWALAALAAGITGVLIAPLQLVTVGTFPLLLANSFAGALLGGLSSLGLAFLGGLVVGVIQSMAVVRYSTPGSAELATLLFVVAILLLRRRWPTAIEDPSTSPRAHRTLSPRLALFAATSRRNLPALAVVGAGIAIVVPAHSTYWAFIGSRSTFYAIEGLALVLVSGWAGQISLMQGAYVGIGAFGTAYLVNEQGFALAPALLVAALAGTLFGAIAGLPALRRLSGLQFAVASLTFAAAAAAWLFQWGDLPRSLARGNLLGLDLASDITVYFVMLGVTAVLFLAAWNLRRSTYGSLLLAAREAPETVAHFGASSSRTRMGVFLFASFIASLGGGLYAVLVSGISSTDFSILLSLSLLIYTVVGGLRSLAGPIVAAVAFGVVPQLLQFEAGSSASAIPDVVAGVLVVTLIAVRPNGIASLFTSPAAATRPVEGAPTPTRDALVGRRAPNAADLALFVHRHPFPGRA